MMSKPTTLRNIRAVLLDAEKRQVKDEAVKIWLEDLKGLAYDMDNVLDEWSSSILKVQIQGVDNALTHKKKVCSCSPFPCFPIRGIHLCHDIALKIGEINRRLDVIAQEKDRTLELANNSIEELPREIAQLIHLRYLNLSDNAWLKELPKAMCNLCNLQTLTLSKCWRLENLPQGLGKLINLRHLETDSTLIRVLPKGIGRLSSLRTLAEIAVVGDDDDDNSFKVGDLPNLNNLCGILQ
ncbi:putative disease resistance protein RGA4 [Vitis vinifera]|uniref:Putative disease resistance protein RGA4 n=1 Tax=Vitis vinifera TaxID=29760 RepID=A0A438FFZ8_VITVI|nr:putative disease resistance protein RGA4 [Vitis vinifera]